MYIISGQNFSKTCKEFGIGPVDEVVGTVVQIIEGHNFTEDVRFRFQEMMDISSSEYKDQVHFKYIIKLYMEVNIILYAIGVDPYCNSE